MFVDHAGQTVAVIDRLTGETREAYVFVAVLGASSYTYAGATWTRGLRDWISSHLRAFEFFQGCGMGQRAYWVRYQHGVTRPGIAS